MSKSRKIFAVSLTERMAGKSAVRAYENEVSRELQTELDNAATAAATVEASMRRHRDAIKQDPTLLERGSAERKQMAWAWKVTQRDWRKASKNYADFFNKTHSYGRHYFYFPPNEGR